ncbi:MAG: phospholipase D-like domain-containing protein [Bryobacteraceae bacterium]
MRLLIQPGSGVAPIVKGIKSARTAVQIMIFRFDRREIEAALVAAAGRGVAVHALIAYTNRGGEKNLRELEMRLLAAGVTVGRTADDLIRYHAKMMIIDKRELYVLGFNFAFMDIEKSRSFGVVTTTPKLVKEAVKLFEADAKRQPYEPSCSTFVVSPHNARQQLAAFIEGAKRELVIYDPKIADPQMQRLLDARAAAGVTIRVIGRMTRTSEQIVVHKLSQIRLHTRSMVRDGKSIFVGSQSLRTAELDARREVGIILTDAKAAGQLLKVFEDDWAGLQTGKRAGAAETDEASPIGKVSRKLAKKVAKVVTKSLRPDGAAFANMVTDVVGADTAAHLDLAELEHAVKESVMEAVQSMVEGAADEKGEGKKEPDAEHVNS